MSEPSSTLNESDNMDDPADHSRGGWRRWQWVLVPLLVLGLFEGAGRVALANYDNWYDVNLADPPDVIVIGSSRSEAGINAAQLSVELSERLDRTVRVENQGRGGSTIAEHYLAIREILESLPEDERDIVIALEIAGGVPDSLMRATWSDPWASDDYLNLLPPFMERQDVGDFLAADQPLRDELAVTTRWALGFSQIVSYREQWRDTFFVRGNDATTKVLERISPSARDASLTADDQARLFTDPVRLAEAREFAQQLAEQEANGGRVVEDWDETILADLIELVRANGGDVVFFTIPVSSGFQVNFEAPANIENAASFAAYTDANDLAVIDLDLDLEDDLFPDLWHLGGEGAALTTEALAARWPLGTLE